MTLIDLDAFPYIGPAKWQRTYRALGGSGGVPGTDRPRLIVIHTMEAPETDGRARSTAAWVRDSGGADQVSTHVTIDNTEIIRCVPDTYTAFTCGSPWNDMSLNAETAGYAAQTDADWRDPYSTAQRELIAQVAAAWCSRWQIPAVYLQAAALVDWRHCSGITTHAQVAIASQNVALTSLGYKPGNHTDPGPFFPMPELISRVRQLITLPPPDPGPGPTPVPPLPSEEDDDMLLMVDTLGNWFLVGSTVRNIGQKELDTRKAAGIPVITDVDGWEAYNLRLAAGVSNNPQP